MVTRSRKRAAENDEDSTSSSNGNPEIANKLELLLQDFDKQCNLLLLINVECVI